VGPRRAVISTLALAGLRVSELCALERQDIDLERGKIHIRDSKTDAGIRVIDIRPRLLEELSSYAQTLCDRALATPAFPTAAGSRRDRNNIARRIIAPTLAQANALRATRHQPPIRTDVTPHTLRRTYITFMLAAGFDVPYVQDQVGHSDPSTTLGIYARVIRRADRDQLRSELRELFGDGQPSTPDQSAQRALAHAPESTRNHPARSQQTVLER
jgi:integrase